MKLDTEIVDLVHGLLPYTSDYVKVKNPRTSINIAHVPVEWEVKQRLTRFFFTIEMWANQQAHGMVLLQMREQ